MEKYLDHEAFKESLRRAALYLSTGKDERGIRVTAATIRYLAEAKRRPSNALRRTLTEVSGDSWGDLAATLEEALESAEHRQKASSHLVASLDRLQRACVTPYFVMYPDRI